MKTKIRLRGLLIPSVSVALPLANVDPVGQRVDEELSNHCSTDSLSKKACLYRVLV